MTFQWNDELDLLILQNRKLEVLALMAEVYAATLATRLVMLTERYDYLRQHRPNDFVCAHDEYWQDFQST